MTPASQFGMENPITRCDRAPGDLDVVLMTA